MLIDELKKSPVPLTITGSHALREAGLLKRESHDIDLIFSTCDDVSKFAQWLDTIGKVIEYEQSGYDDILVRILFEFEITQTKIDCFVGQPIDHIHHILSKKLQIMLDRRGSIGDKTYQKHWNDFKEIFDEIQIRT